jgi:nitrous oxidase accessory protein NosD
MMRARITIVIAATMAALALGAAPALAATWHVTPGHSIQAAVDKAKPGDTIQIAAGTYHQTVVILNKDGIKLIGAGWDKTIIKMPAHPSSPCADSPSSVPGICIAGVDPNTGQPGTPVSGTRISGLRVVGFSDAGVIFFNDADSKVTWVKAIGNAGYGITGFVNQGITFAHDVAIGSQEAGFYVGDSSNAQAVVMDDLAIGNTLGILYRDSEHATITGNVFQGNCVGIMALDTGGPGGDGFVNITHNRVFHNQKVCPQGPELPPLSGIGILLMGTTNAHVMANRVTKNAPAGATVASGGILVKSAVPFGGAAPTSDVVSGNYIHDNLTADLKYDGSGSGNTLTGNDCGTSHPAGLC